MAIIDGSAVCYPAGYEPPKCSFELKTDTHFTCNSCDRNWVVEGMPNNTVWYCPWCGVKQEVDPKRRGYERHSV